MNTVKIMAIVLGIILFASFAFAATDSSVTGSAANQITGLVTDSVCKGLNVYKAHTQYSCAQDCVRLKNADYVLVVGPNVYTLQGNKADLGKFAGGRATVKGQIHGDKIAVESISQ